MLRSTLFRSIRPSIAYRSPIVASRNYGIIDSATKAVFGEKGLKEKKAKEGELKEQGEELADKAKKAGQQVADKASEAVDGAKDATQNATKEFSDKAEGISEYAKRLADEVAGNDPAVEGASIEEFERVEEKDGKLKRSKRTVIEEEEEEEARERVHENVQGQGYTSLQEKGREAPVQQNRPDDGVY